MLGRNLPSFHYRHHWNKLLQGSRRYWAQFWEPLIKIPLKLSFGFSKNPPKQHVFVKIFRNWYYCLKYYNCQFGWWEMIWNLKLLNINHYKATDQIWSWKTRLKFRLLKCYLKYHIRHCWIELLITFISFDYLLKLPSSPLARILQLTAVTRTGLTDVKAMMLFFELFFQKFP